MRLAFLFSFALSICLVYSAIFDINDFDSSLPEGCDTSRVVVYRMVLKTWWTEEKFPKSYPKFRPPAQWSLVFGQSHGPAFSIFRLGSLASSGLRRFAERGDPRGLAALEKDAAVFDQFTAESIKTGRGQTEQEFFVDGNHTMVSVVCRIVPSPDWFIGVSGVDLCSEGEWIENITLHLSPLDAGTDGGLTFTAPRWRLHPPDLVASHAATRPAHAAASFHYPGRTALPDIAEVHIVKIKEYDFEDAEEKLTEDDAFLKPDENGTLNIEMVTVNSTLNDTLTELDTYTYRTVTEEPQSNQISNGTEEILKNIKNSYLKNNIFFPKVFRPRVSFTAGNESRKSSSVSSNLLTSFLTTKKTNASLHRSSYFSW